MAGRRHLGTDLPMEHNPQEAELLEAKHTVVVGAVERQPEVHTLALPGAERTVEQQPVEGMLAACSLALSQDISAALSVRGDLAVRDY